MCKQAYCAYKWEILTIFFLNLRSVKPSSFYQTLPGIVKRDGDNGEKEARGWIAYKVRGAAYGAIIYIYMNPWATAAGGFATADVRTSARREL